MKVLTKSITLFFLVCMFGCNKEEDGNDNTNSLSNASISPPSWIIGEWLLDSELASNTGFRFLSDNMIQINSFSETNIKVTVQNGLNSGLNMSVINESTPTTYKLKIDYGQGTNQTWFFTKFSNTKICWDVVSSCNGDYVKQ